MLIIICLYVQELVQEMDRVRNELEMTKFELEGMQERDRKLSTERDNEVREQMFEVCFLT